jgi:hypothetical protein
MTTELWFSYAAAQPGGDLADGWEYGGELDSSRESDLWKVVQGVLGLRAASRARAVGFYGDLDPDAAVYQRFVAEHPQVSRGAGLGDSKLVFWLALRWTRPHGERTFFSTRTAQLAPLARRTPEVQPGSVKRLVPVPIRLRADASGRLLAE